MILAYNLLYALVFVVNILICMATAPLLFYVAVWPDLERTVDFIKEKDLSAGEVARRIIKGATGKGGDEE